MMTFQMKSKKFAWLTALTVFVLATTGCAQDAPDVEEVDLTAAGDLFQQPLQPNPLSRRSADTVITVDGTPITHGEIMQGVQMNMMQLSQQVPQQQLAQMAGQIYQNVQDTLIANILLTKAAAASGIEVTDEELDQEIDLIKANAPEGMSLEQALADNDISMDEWKESLREQMLVRKLVEEKTDAVLSVTAEEVAAFYQENIESFQVPEQVEASHILIAFDEDETDETRAAKRARLVEIRNEILGGAAFDALAAEHSDCPSGQRGGMLGAFGRGQMVPEFEEAAFAATIDDVTDIVESPFGYHLILVSDRQEESLLPLAEIREQLEEYMVSQRKQEALIDYINELREKADIQFLTPDLDSE